MSYHVYTTEAIILKRRDFGEADSLFSFFTKDFGRLEVRAQGVRHLKSKLRYHLSGLSFVKIAFVAASGDSWRLVDAEEIGVLKDTREDEDKTKCALKIFSLLERLIQGQESDRELWEGISSVLVFLENNELGKGELRNFAIESALDVATHLGYADKRGKLSPVLAIKFALEQSHL